MFQGVHMILDGDHQRAWKDGEKRDSRLVFIGRNLPEEKIRKGSRAAWRDAAGRCIRPTPADTLPSSTARGPSRRARRSSPCIFSAAPRCSCSARRRWCWFAGRRRAARRRRTPAAFSRRRATASASSPAATTARWSRPTRTANEHLATDAKRRWIDRVALGPDGAVAWSAGKKAFVRTAQGRARIARRALHRRRACVRAEGLSPRDRALQRRVAVVSERAGRARDARMEGLALDVAVQPGRQVPRHRDAGADAARLAARRRQAHAHVRLSAQGALDGLDARAASGSRPPARSSSSCGRSQARTARWASSRACWRPQKRAVAVACHPNQESVAVGYDDGWCCLRIEDGAEMLAKSRARRRHGARVERGRPLLAFGTEDGEAGIDGPALESGRDHRRYPTSAPALTDWIHARNQARRVPYLACGSSSARSRRPRTSRCLPSRAHLPLSA